MFMVVHIPLGSADQAIEQLWPSIKTSPGPGAVGVGSAWMRVILTAASRTVKIVANILERSDDWTIFCKTAMCKERLGKG